MKPNWKITNKKMVNENLSSCVTSKFYKPKNIWQIFVSTLSVYNEQTSTYFFF